MRINITRANGLLYPSSMGRSSACAFTLIEARKCGGQRRAAPSSKYARAFTLIETVISVALMMILITSALSSLLFLNRSSSRLSTYVSAMAVVEGKIEKIRAATYNPPSSPFGTNTLITTNIDKIALDLAGTNLLVTGSVISKIQPVAAGHLVTVTGTFATPGTATIVSLQTIVNKFSGGQQ